MPLDELSNIAHNWFAAFKARDIESLLQLYHDEATHYSPKLKIRHPETKGLIKGKHALRTWWQDAFLRLPSLKYELIRLTPYEDRIFMEYIRHVNGEVDLAVGEMLEIQAGKIIHSKVFHQ